MARIARLEQHERNRSLLARLGSLIWKLIVSTVLLAAVGAIGWVYVQSRADGEICACIQKKFQACYENQGLHVSIQGARRVEGKGIELRHLKIIQFGEQRPIAEIDEVFIACSTDLADLMTKKVDVRHVELRRPKLRATRDRNGDWNLAKLIQRKSPDLKIPTITIENGHLEVRDLGRDSDKPLNLMDINVDVTPTPDLRQKTLVWNDGPSPPTASPNDQQPSPPKVDNFVRIRGRLTGEHLRRVDVDAYVGLASGAWSMKGSVDELAISPALFDTLPGEVASRVVALASLRASIRFDFQAERNPDQLTPRFQVKGELTEGRFEDGRLPASLTEMTARFSANNRELKVEQFTAKCGAASLQLSLNCQGFTEESPVTLRASARNFEVNDQVVSILPETAQAVWDKFTPRGLINADVLLTYDGQKWNPEVKIEFLDVSFAYFRFPFRLQNGRGTLTLKDGLLSSENMRAIANERTIRIKLQARDPGINFFGWVELASEEPVPLDEKLLVALDADQEKVVRSLRPRGDVTIWGRFGRRRAGDPIERHLEIGLRDCHVNFVGFPYPLDRVRGVLAMTNGQWEFRDLQGHNDSTYVQCKGTWTTTPEQGPQLQLAFEASDVMLDDELKNALKPSMQRFWTNLRPNGSIDHMTANVQYSAATKNLSMDVRAEKWPPKQTTEARSITVRPTWFPYQWDNLVGEVRYRNGEIELKDLRATHGRSALQLSGTGAVAADDSWSARFTKFVADRVIIDQELMAALPSRFGEAAAKLNFNGPVGAQGSVELAGSGKVGELPRANWNLTLDVEGGSVKVGVPLQQIRGSIQLVGGADETSFYSQGELDIHSLICQDIQFTQIRGPIRLEPTQIIFGDFWSGQKNLSRPPRQTTCRVFGGAAAADAVVRLGNDIQFEVQTSLNDVDMALVARDALPKKRDISGRAFATVRLRGTDKGMHTFSGDGQMQLREADVYDVPVASGLFNRLKVRRLDVAGFTSCDMDFNVQGDRVYFKRLDLIGNALTLKGTGEMGLDRQINLNFYTMVGRDEMRVPFITPVLAEASRQLFEVQVRGTMDDPKIDQRAVPVISDALRQMFPELTDRRAERIEAREQGKGFFQRSPTPR